MPEKIVINSKVIMSVKVRCEKKSHKALFSSNLTLRAIEDIWLPSIENIQSSKNNLLYR